MKLRNSGDPIRDLKMNIKQLDIAISKRPSQIARLAKPLRAGAERQLEKDRALRAELQTKLDALEGTAPAATADNHPDSKT